LQQIPLSKEILQTKQQTPKNGNAASMQCFMALSDRANESFVIVWM